ncbi:MAG: sigma-70 family RNA polymerase sigma factor [Gammaproteobacteria bacterium]
MAQCRALRFQLSFVELALWHCAQEGPQGPPARLATERWPDAEVDASCEENVPSDVSDHETPEQDLDRHQQSRTLAKAIAALSAEHRTVIELTFFQGLPYQDIAEIVGAPVNTIKTRMFHARRRLAEILTEQR